MRKIFILLTLVLLTAQAKEIYATFTVQADKSANLAFSSSGIVDAVKVDIGSVVKKGDVLAKLQNDDYKASLNITKTALKYAKRDYDRHKKVKSIIDQSQLDKVASKYANAKAQLTYKQALLNKTILKAPFDGIIYDKAIEVGDAVSGAMIRTVFKIQSHHDRKLLVEFDQKYWTDVKVGDTFSYKIDGSDNTYQGVISKIYPTIDAQQRKIKAEVKAKDFIVGLFGDGTIITKEKK